MSLTACRDCGKPVSRNAAQCPNCGAVVNRSGRIIVALLIIAIVVGIGFAGWREWSAQQALRRQHQETDDFVRSLGR